MWCAAVEPDSERERPHTVSVETSLRMPPVSGEEESSGGLKRSDSLCPVCLDIFLEPVTLPCMHTFCKPCFMQTVDKSNMCCPLCRKRVSTWARLNSRKKTLVNEDLWRRIQEAFPTQCERRAQGIEDDDDAVYFPSNDPETPRVSAGRAEERV